MILYAFLHRESIVYMGTVWVCSTILAFQSGAANVWFERDSLGMQGKYTQNSSNSLSVMLYYSDLEKGAQREGLCPRIRLVSSQMRTY